VRSRDKEQGLALTPIALVRLRIAQNRLAACEFYRAPAIVLHGGISRPDADGSGKDCMQGSPSRLGVGETFPQQVAQLVCLLGIGLDIGFELVVK